MTKPEKINISGNDKMTLVSSISTMLGAGIPILETIDSLLEDSKGNQKKVLETLKEDLIQGRRIHMSLARFPLIFDKVTVNIIKASEEAGTLDVALKDLKDNIKKEMEFLDKVRSALIYPVVILIVFGAIFLLILTFVVPKIAKVFSRLSVSLPLPTKVMIYLSDLLTTYTIPTFGGLFLITIGFIFLLKTQKRRILGIFSKLPLVSKLAREIDLTRFTRSFFLLLTSGIPISTALELTEDVVIGADVSKAIQHARERVMAGAELSDGFKESKRIIPTIVIKMIEAGEKSGTLDKSMQDASEYLDYQVSNTLKTLTTLLEPIMLVFAGALIGGMMLAIVSPIYGLIGQVGAGR